MVERFSNSKRTCSLVSFPTRANKKIKMPSVEKSSETTEKATADFLGRRRPIAQMIGAFVPRPERPPCKIFRFEAKSTGEVEASRGIVGTVRTTRGARKVTLQNSNPSLPAPAWIRCYADSLSVQQDIARLCAVALTIVLLLFPRHHLDEVDTEVDGVDVKAVDFQNAQLDLGAAVRFAEPSEVHAETVFVDFYGLAELTSYVCSFSVTVPPEAYKSIAPLDSAFGLLERWTFAARPFFDLEGSQTEDASNHRKAMRRTLSKLSRGGTSQWTSGNVHVETRTSGVRLGVARGR